MLERPEDYCLDFLRRLALGQPSLCHYSNFMVAECDGRPAAAMCGFDPREGGWPAMMQAAWPIFQKLAWSEADLMAMMQRSGVIPTCAADDTEGAWVVENVATLPEFRRRGLVDALMRRMLDEGHRRGHKLAQISVFIGNTPAQAAYEKAGFKIVAEKRDPDFEAALKTPGMRHLLREI